MTWAIVPSERLTTSLHEASHAAMAALHNVASTECWISEGQHNLQGRAGHAPSGCPEADRLTSLAGAAALGLCLAGGVGGNVSAPAAGFFTIDAANWRARLPRGDQGLAAELTVLAADLKTAVRALALCWSAVEYLAYDLEHENRVDGERVRRHMQTAKPHSRLCADAVQRQAVSAALHAFGVAVAQGRRAAGLSNEAPARSARAATVVNAESAADPPTTRAGLFGLPGFRTSDPRPIEIRG